MKTAKIPGGLGDAMAVAACLQHYSFNHDNEKILFNTLPAMEPILRYHPTIELTNSIDSKIDFDFKWASKFQEMNLWFLHIKQKYSYQMGFFISPVYTVNIFDKDQKIRQNNKSERIVAINSSSSHPTKRFIPEDLISEYLLPLIVKLGYEPVFIGNCDSFDGNTNISDCIDILEQAHLFIGTVSGLAYLAEALNCQRMIFCTSVPYYHDMSPKNLIPIMPKEDCILDCECNINTNIIDTDLYMQRECNAFHCKNTFDYNDIESQLERLLCK